jgi:hypothetical protein
MMKKRLSKKSSSEDSFLRRYREALRDDGVTKADLEAFARVKIAPPAVRPKDVRPATIRKAVREAMRKYVEKHESTKGN